MHVHSSGGQSSNDQSSNGQSSNGQSSKKNYVMSLFILSARAGTCLPRRRKRVFIIVLCSELFSNRVFSNKTRVYRVYRVYSVYTVYWVYTQYTIIHPV